MKKLLPPILLLLFITLMGLICWATDSPHLISVPYVWLGLPFILLGLALSAAGKYLFKVRQTNIMTFDEPDCLVTEGVFSFSRNPMYLGFSIIIWGSAVSMGAAWSSLGLAILFVLITDRWYIEYEEKAMQKKFGKRYHDYCQNVRRWI